MNADKPLRVTNRGLHPHEQIGRNQPNALADKLEDRPNGVTVWGFQLLVQNQGAVTLLIDLLGAVPEKVKAELARLLAELRSLLPLFAEQLAGWKVIEDLGQPLPEDWDPRPFLEGLKVDCVHPDGAEYMKGEDLVTEARARLAGRGGFSQHELDWFYRHWTDERIPGWFRKAMEDPEKRIHLIATETVLLDPDGRRFVLCLYWYDGQLLWRCFCLGGESWDRRSQVLVPGNSCPS